MFKSFGGRAVLKIFWGEPNLTQFCVDARPTSGSDTALCSPRSLTFAPTVNDRLCEEVVQDLNFKQERSS